MFNSQRDSGRHLAGEDSVTVIIYGSWTNAAKITEKPTDESSARGNYRNDHEVTNEANHCLYLTSTCNEVISDVRSQNLGSFTRFRG